MEMDDQTEDQAPSLAPLSVDTQVNNDLVTCLQGRFKNLHPIGYGSSGLVYAGHDCVNDRDVAVKRLLFTDQRRSRQGFREISLMRKLQHENIVSTLDLLNQKGESIQGSSPDFTSVFLVQELLDVNLHVLIQSKQIKPDHVRLITYQILRAMKYIHSANVLHRDLKPTNVLVNCDTLLVKISDFGLARVVDPNYGHQGCLTERVGTSGYRSPELIFHPDHYTQAIDMWAVGCIMAEMLLERPLFPGANDLDQLFHMLDTLPLSEEDWCKVLAVMPNKRLKNHPMRPRHQLKTRFHFLCDPSAIQLMEALLTFDPAQRATAEQVLSCPYLADYHERGDEPVAEVPFTIEHEVDDLPIDSLTQLIVSQLSCTRNCGSISHDTPTAHLETTPVHRDSPTTSLRPPSPADNTLNSHLSQSALQFSDLSIQSDCSNHGSLSNISETSSQGDSELTLEEILSLPAEDSPPMSSSASVTLTFADSSPQDQVLLKNMRNTRSCESLGDIQDRGHNHNIYRCKNTNLGFINCEKKDEEDFDDEKEVAEVSEKKMMEDREIEERIKHEVIEETEPVGVECDVPDDVVNVREELPTVDDTPLFNDGLQDSNRVSNVDKSVFDPKRDDSFVSRKQKQDYQDRMSRKLILDKIQREKSDDCSQPLTGEEMDELYRLPTDHLHHSRHDYDFNNTQLQRAARKKMSRDDRREKFRDDFYLEGACGGHESFSGDEMIFPHRHSSPTCLSDDESNVVHLEKIWNTDPTTLILHRSDPVQITSPSLPRTTGNVGSPQVDTRASRDPTSSPESPASPRSRHTGARPKRSPKKQRAL